MYIECNTNIKAKNDPDVINKMNQAHNAGIICLDNRHFAIISND